MNTAEHINRILDTWVGKLAERSFRVEHNQDCSSHDDGWLCVAEDTCQKVKIVGVGITPHQARRAVAIQVLDSNPDIRSRVDAIASEGP